MPEVYYMIKKSTKEINFHATRISLALEYPVAHVARIKDQIQSLILTLTSILNYNSTKITKDNELMDTTFRYFLSDKYR